LKQQHGTRKNGPSSCVFCALGRAFGAQLPMQKKKHKVGCYFCDFVLSEISWKKLVIFCVLGFQDFLGTVGDGPERAAR